MTAPNLADYLRTWNPPAAKDLRAVRLEDETLRDGIQGPYVRQPSLEEKRELLRHSVAVGIAQAMLGFPASSPEECAHCESLLGLIGLEKWELAPHFLARPLEADLEAIVRLQQSASLAVWADFWVNASPLRMHIEGWSLGRACESIQTAGRYLVREGLPFSVSFEDATRTPADSIAELVRCSLDAGATMIAICDTAGDSTPAGAARLTEFVARCIDGAGSRVPILWHGHNDRGLALANAMAAAEAGAEIISGTFLGVGERAGNTPLEQVVACLHSAGHRGLHPECVPGYCDAVAACLGLIVPDFQPLIGRQAFATGAGTHAAAIVKASAFGPDFADRVFSSVPAAMIDRRQEIVVGPAMGHAGASYKLAELGLEPSVENVERLLRFARAQRACLADADILSLLKP